MTGLLYADDLVECGENLRAMDGRFVEVCGRRGLKVNAGKSKVMLLNGGKGLECEVYVDGIRLEHVSEFNFSDIWDVFGMNQVQMGQKVVGKLRVGEGLQMPLGS